MRLKYDFWFSYSVHNCFKGLDEEQMVRMTKFDVAKNMRDHYCLVKNLSGCPLGKASCTAFTLFLLLG